MKLPQQITTAAFALTMAVYAGNMYGEDTPPGAGQELLEKVKQRDLERQIAAKQKELDRLQEDVAKSKLESDDLQQSIKTTDASTKETSGHLDQLLGEKKRIDHLVDVTGLKIAAERLKAEGLKLLSDAQNKSLQAMAKKSEETDIRTSVAAAELHLLASSQSGPRSESVPKTSTAKLRSDLVDQRKRLLKAESATLTAERAAVEAMKEASAKLEMADAAASKAQHRQSEIENLPPVASDGTEPSPEKGEAPKTPPPIRTK